MKVRQAAIRRAGEAGLLVVFGTDISELNLRHVLSLERFLDRERPAWLVTQVPAYASLLCVYDPNQAEEGQVQEELSQYLRKMPLLELQGRHHTVPVVYDGPDLAFVATHTSLAPEEIVRIHTSINYLVYCLGFAPGFVYCGELPVTLATPRRRSPRGRVAAGSVGIAGRQTGIYGVDSPGGWQLIGRTVVELFNPRSRPPSPFRQGDRIRFVRARD